MPSSSDLSSQLILLTRPHAYLRRVLKMADVVERRFADTWHRDTLQPHWARTIGMWGGVRTHEDIMKRASVNYNVFKAFRARHALTSKNGALNSLRPQYELAISAYVRWKSAAVDPTPENVSVIATHFGILPIELRTYVDRVELLLSELGIGAEQLVSKAGYDLLAPHWTAHQEDIDATVVSTYSE